MNIGARLREGARFISIPSSSASSVYLLISAGQRVDSSAAPCHHYPVTARAKLSPHTRVQPAARGAQSRVQPLWLNLWTNKSRYSMSISYNVSTWSEVKAIGTASTCRRLTRASPLSASSVYTTKPYTQSFHTGMACEVNRSNIPACPATWTAPPSTAIPAGTNYTALTPPSPAQPSRPLLVGTDRHDQLPTSAASAR